MRVYVYIYIALKNTYMFLEKVEITYADIIEQKIRKV